MNPTLDYLVDLASAHLASLKCLTALALFALVYVTLTRAFRR